MEWMILPLKRYAQFGGRSRRKEYWMFVLFTIIVGAILGVIDGALGLTLGGGGQGVSFRSGNGVLGSIFSLATLVPSIAVAVRRLHDTDRSGWWIAAPLVVLLVAVFGVLAFGFGAGSPGASAGLGIGMIVAVIAALASAVVLLVFFCLDGTRGPNRFGPDPKGSDLADVFA